MIAVVGITQAALDIAAHQVVGITADVRVAPLGDKHRVDPEAGLVDNPVAFEDQLAERGIGLVVGPDGALHFQPDRGGAVKIAGGPAIEVVEGHPDHLVGAGQAGLFHFADLDLAVAVQVDLGTRIVAAVVVDIIERRAEVGGPVFPVAGVIVEHFLLHRIGNTADRHFVQFGSVIDHCGLPQFERAPVATDTVGAHPLVIGRDGHRLGRGAAGGDDPSPGGADAVGLPPHPQAGQGGIASVVHQAAPDQAVLVDHPGSAAGVFRPRFRGKRIMGGKPVGTQPVAHVADVGEGLHRHIV